MAQFHLFVPIQVRYGDIDAQGHVNNSKFLTYLEQSRVEYLFKLGLWDGQDFQEVGLIVADVHIAYLLPIELRQSVQVAIRVAHIGNKSLRFEYEVQNTATGAVAGTRRDGDGGLRLPPAYQPSPCRMRGGKKSPHLKVGKPIPPRSEPMQTSATLPDR